MKLPPTFFYKFFKENTFFVIDKTIYNIKSDINANGILSVGGKKFSLSEGLKLTELEGLYFSNNGSELKEYGNSVLQKILSEEKEINRDYHELGKDIEFIEFFWYKILKNKKEEKPKVKPIKIQKKEASLIDNLFQYDCFVWEGRFYNLNNNHKGLFSARIRNKVYSDGESLELNLEELEGRYLKGIEEKIYNQLTKGQNSLLNKIESLKGKKELIDILKKGEYFDEEENIGFKKDNQDFFVTKKAASDCPKKINGEKTYVLYEISNGKYYRFNEALIGVKLTKKNNKIQWHDPVVIQPYIHPALSKKSFVPHQRLCQGGLSYGKLTQGKSFEDAVKSLLSEGKRLILHGYFLPGGTGAYFALSDRHFQELETKEYDKREVTNRK